MVSRLLVGGTMRVRRLGRITWTGVDGPWASVATLKPKYPTAPLPKETPVLGSHVPGPPEVPQYLSLRDVGSFSGFRALDI